MTSSNSISNLFSGIHNSCLRIGLFIQEKRECFLDSAAGSYFINLCSPIPFEYSLNYSYDWLVLNHNINRYKSCDVPNE